MPPLPGMILSAHQLHYLPWLRYIHKIASSDIFVVLDNIQFNKNGWQNRNKIKGPQGAALLTVPVLHRLGQTLDEVRIEKTQPWRRKHWGSIQNAYRKAPHFAEHEAFFKQVYEREWDRLNDLNYEIFNYLLAALKVRTRIVRGSELELKGEATDRLAGICRDLGAKIYLTGSFAAEQYLEKEMFERDGIEVQSQHFECPQYPQMFPEAGFIPELSVLDLLFNCGPKSLEVLMNGSQKTAGAP